MNDLVRQLNNMGGLAVQAIYHFFFKGEEGMHLFLGLLPQLGFVLEVEAWSELVGM